MPPPPGPPWAERALLRALVGHCHAPIAGHANPITDAAGDLHLAARIYSLDGPGPTH